MGMHILILKGDKTNKTKRCFAVSTVMSDLSLYPFLQFTLWPTVLGLRLSAYAYNLA